MNFQIKNILVRPAVYFPCGFGCLRLRKVATVGHHRRRSPRGGRPINPACEEQRQTTLLTWRQHEWIDVFHVENSSLLHNLDVSRLINEDAKYTNIDWMHCIALHGVNYDSWCGDRFNNNYSRKILQYKIYILIYRYLLLIYNRSLLCVKLLEDKT